MGLRGRLLRFLRALGIERSDDDLAREQYRQLSQQMPLLYSVVFVNTLFLAATTGQYVGLAGSLFFPTVAAIALIVRGSTWRRRARNYSGQEDISIVRRAIRSNIIAANVMALILGVWALWVLKILPQQYLAFVPLFAILSTITCTYCLMSLPIAAYSIIITGTGMIAIGMLMNGDPMLRAITGNVGVVSILIIYMVSRQYFQLRGIVMSRSALNAQQQTANELAHQDQLTGLPNRRALLDALKARTLDSADLPVALAMLDLNGFKPVNDTYGHAVGDRVLAEVGGRLNAAVEKTAFVARLGGDEFAILMSDKNDVGAIYQLRQ
jgi:predicted signal transduction protein with EAL and GGDEF domain